MSIGSTQPRSQRAPPPRSTPLPRRASDSESGVWEGQGPRRQRAQSRAGRLRRKATLAHRATSILPSTRARAEQAGGGQQDGFTGQEHDEDFGLINMHGRMYDPVLGQFTSADPVVQERPPGTSLFDPNVGALAQNAGGPDTGAEGVGQNGTTIPSQRGDAAIADVAMNLKPIGEERAAAKVAERLRIFARIGRFFKDLLALEKKIAPSIGPKIAGQMGPRGWTREAIEEAIKSGQ